MKQTLKELRFAVIHSLIIVFLIVISGRFIEDSGMSGLSKMVIYLTVICFILIVYISGLLFSLEIKRKYPAQYHFTFRFYEKNILRNLHLIIFYWLKWQCLKAYIFLVRVKYEMNDKVHYSRGRYFSIEPIFCPDCLWCGFTKSAIHTYKNYILDTESVDKCPKCENEL